MSQDSPETPPAPPSLPTKIPEEDMYKVANAALRLQNVQLQKQLLLRDEQQIIADLNAATLAVGVKYGLDPAKHRVLPDGTIVPATSPLAAGQRLPGM